MGEGRLITREIQYFITVGETAHGTKICRYIETCLITSGYFYKIRLCGCFFLRLVGLLLMVPHRSHSLLYLVACHRVRVQCITSAYCTCCDGIAQTLDGKATMSGQRRKEQLVWL